MSAAGPTPFIKTSHQDTDAFLKEAEGLSRLAAVGKIRVVKVLAADRRSITLEKITTESARSEYWQRLGRELADFHRGQNDYFGFDIDNFIGATVQKNPRVPIGEISWADYFIRFRLQALAEFPTISQHPELSESLKKSVPFFRKILSEVQEKPTLVHGDLWSGNVLCATGQEPVLIDPAPYYGHREVDLAMTELFGGFDSVFYQSYQSHFPLPSGYDQRREIYNLYHLLNHYILFGGGYADQALATLKETIKLI